MPNIFLFKYDWRVPSRLPYSLLSGIEKNKPAVRSTARNCVAHKFAALAAKVDITCKRNVAYPLSNSKLL